MTTPGKLPKPPETYREFVKKYPKLGKAWDILAEAGEEGPLDARMIRMIKLSISIGAMREGAVHSAVRKALSVGVTREEIDQIVSLAASTIGLPSTVAVYSWVRDVYEKHT